MSTGSKLIRAVMWQPLDGSSSNAIPRGITIPGSTTQKVQIPVWAFDGSGSVAEYLCYTTRCPVDYASGGEFKILWGANTTTAGNVKWQAQVQAITPGDTETPFEHAWSTAATATTGVNTTEARRLIESSITLNMDSAVAGDELSFLLFRDPTDGSDTAGIEAEMHSVEFQYTA